MIFESSGLLGYGLGRSNDGEERARVLEDDDGLALVGVFFFFATLELLESIGVGMMGRKREQIRVVGKVWHVVTGGRQRACGFFLFVFFSGSIAADHGILGRRHGMDRRINTKLFSTCFSLSAVLVKGCLDVVVEDVGTLPFL